MGRAVASSDSPTESLWRCLREGFDNIFSALHQYRAVADQAVGATAARVERRARHREHLAALFAGETSGNQRARARRRLDHDDTARQAGNDRLRRGKWRAWGTVASGGSAITTPRTTISS